MWAMAIVLGIATLALVVISRPVIALLVGIACFAQVVALLATPRGRAVVTVLLTDVVDSTRAVSDLGDAAWQQLFDRHAAAARREFKRVPAAVVKDLGDGFLAAFPILIAPPGRVVVAALRLAAEAADAGMPTGTGIHAGECALTREDVRGLAVHVAARLMESAAPGQVLISGTVRELLGGTDLQLASVGEREFKGLGEPVRVYAVSRGGS
jgi:class 3 adenylate cyclase